MSTVRANQILDAAGGNTAQINGMTPTAQSLQGFRNRLINGNMVIDQRNAGASVTIPASAYTYTLDRWAGFATQASKFTVQRNAGSVTPPAGFTNYLGVVVGASANVTVGSSDLFILQQSIEGFNIADLGWGASGATPITVSFWVRASLTGTFGGAINTNFGSNAYPFTYTINSANTWEYKTISIAGPTTGGTTDWPVNNTSGLRLNFSLGAGSTLLGTAGAWAAVDRFSATGSTNLIATNGATFYITGVQLEAGSVATPFEQIDYGRELMMCQRYLPAFLGGSNAFFGSALNTTQQFVSVTFPVQVRAAPSGLVVSSASHFTASDYISSAGPCVAISLAVAGLNNASIIANVTSPTVLTQARPGNMSANSSSAILYFTGCEL
jgi:hypothetical protein